MKTFFWAAGHRAAASAVVRKSAPAAHRHPPARESAANWPLDDLAEKHFSHSKNLYLIQLKVRRQPFQTPMKWIAPEFYWTAESYNFMDVPYSLFTFLTETCCYSIKKTSVSPAKAIY